jgi:hypothetical protein
VLPLSRLPGSAATTLHRNAATSQDLPSIGIYHQKDYKYQVIPFKAQVFKVHSSPQSFQVTMSPSVLAPGVGMRRKGPKSLPRLPLSAFTPPNTGTSDRFPLPPTPSNVHPSVIIDAHVIPSHDGDLSQWKREIGLTTGGKVGGAVLSLVDAEQNTVTRSVDGPDS